MKLMKTEDAVGQILCQDITQIIRGGYKGPVFRKGHVITEEDIPVLLSVGKDNIYIWENDGSLVHENDGAEILYEFSAGQNIRPGDDIKEGKIELFAEIDGLFKVDREKLLAVNSLGEMMIASRHGDFPVKAGDKLAGERIIPLAIEKEKMEKARETVFGRAAEGSENGALPAAVGGKDAGAGKIFNVLPFHHKKVGIVTTGKGVAVHTIDCQSLEQFANEPERWLDIAWGEEAENEVHTGRLKVMLANEPGALAELSNLIARAGANISNLNIVNRTMGYFEILLDIDVKDLKHLNDIIAALKGAKEISYVARANK